jgi:hypothetical protein
MYKYIFQRAENFFSVDPSSTRVKCAAISNAKKKQKHWRFSLIHLLIMQMEVSRCPMLTKKQMQVFCSNGLNELNGHAHLMECYQGGGARVSLGRGGASTVQNDLCLCMGPVWVEICTLAPKGTAGSKGFFTFWKPTH